MRNVTSFMIDEFLTGFAAANPVIVTDICCVAMVSPLSRERGPGTCATAPAGRLPVVGGVFPASSPPV
ncbi:MAG: hypothetical protein L0M05_07895, partial [Corynebacterium variabile]|nr:hypothetical protein [Corynebacterium variabile]